MTQPTQATVADYFFVAGLDDAELLLPSAGCDYYRHQELALKKDPRDDQQPSRKRGKSLPLYSSAQEQDSLVHGMLHHVQTVIDNFDKERDIARDNVIALLPENTAPTTSTSLDLASTRPPQRQHRARQYSLSILPSMTKKAPRNPFTTTQPHLLDIRYTPTVLLRAPEERDQMPFPPYLSMFCFPHDISLVYASEPPPERVHSFAMTDDVGTTIYGTCCIFYEPVSEKFKPQVNDILQSWVHDNVPTSTVEYARHLLEKMRVENDKLQALQAGGGGGHGVDDEDEDVLRTCKENLALYRELLEPVKRSVCDADHLWIPRAVGLLGRMPWLEFYGDWIKILLDSVVGVRGKKNTPLSLDVPSTVHYLLNQVPIPPPGRFEIGLAINDRPLFISRPAMNEVPILKNFSLYPLFRALSPHLILAILETLLAEGKVVFLSQHLGMLSVTAEAFRYLLFPFYWPYVYIPIVPEKLLTCLQAPVPYIIGFQGNIDDIEDYRPDDACIVNLDSNTMHQNARVPMLPERQRRKLQASLDQHCSLHTRCHVGYGVPLAIQHAFPKGRLMMTSHRSKVPISYDAPTNTMTNGNANNHASATSTVSSTSSSWLSRKSHLPGRSLYTSSSEANGTNTSVNGLSRTSNDSSHSSADLSQSAMPQVPSFARLSINPHALSSTSSFQSAHSVSPISPSRSHDRSSLPGTPKSAHSTLAASSNNDIMDVRGSHRLSEPPMKRKDESTQQDNERRFSDIMPKPHATFYQESSPKYKGNYVNTPLSHQMYHHYASSSPSPPSQHKDAPTRRVKHVEGHIMTSLLSQELTAFAGYRCLCGKTVDKDDPRQQYMLCQECHLVTHDMCAEHILHPCLPASFDENKVHEAFLRMFASLLYSYRSGIKETATATSPGKNDTPRTSVSSPSALFSKDEFLRHSDKDTRDYLAHLVDSHLFNHFITQRLTRARNDPEILMFDEFIKLKLNRSKLKFVKAGTPFLNDDSYRVSQVIWTTPAKVCPKREYDRFPTDWSPPSPTPLEDTTAS
ncbi:AEX-3 domain-containing protein [Gongronella butleri]|nr:AEX-3 domain-containing protein [Gongronella butleri]